MKTIIIATLIAATLSACATRGANYVPLVDHHLELGPPDYGKFNRDVSDCQQYAKQRIDAASGAAVGAIAGAMFMALLAPKNSGNQWARDGAIIGGASGAVAANETQESITKKCLAGRGYNVLN